MFNFNEADTRIFEYSRGERNPDGTFKIIYADPATIRRQLDISLPNRNQLVDQYLAGQHVKKVKAAEAYAHEQARHADPALPDKIIEFTDDENAAIRMGGIAHQKICNGIRDAFELLPFDSTTGIGCTEYMTIAVLNHWDEWLEKKDGSTPPLQTSSPPASSAA